MTTKKPKAEMQNTSLSEIAKRHAKYTLAIDWAKEGSEVTILQEECGCVTMKFANGRATKTFCIKHMPQIA